MSSEELKAKMLEFIATQDGDYDEEWYASRWDFAATVLSDFAEYLGFVLDVPSYVRRKDTPEINRNEVLKALLPEIEKLFNVEFDRYVKAQQKQAHD